MDIHPILISDLLGIPEEYKHVFYTWMAMAVLFVIAYCLRGRMKLIPTGLQNVMEVIIGGLEEFAVNTCGGKIKAVFPVICASFLYIFAQNLLGLIPGCDAPTANINNTAAMAIFIFLYYNSVGLRRWGPRYIKHFMGPMLPLVPLMLPIEIISHLARPLSLSLRLFGNIRGEEIVLGIFFAMAPIIATLPIYFLFSLAKALQAFIFFMLAMLYLSAAMDEAH